MTNDDLKKECDVCREKFRKELSNFEHRLTTMEVVLWGRDGGNGLKGMLGELQKKMDTLLRFFWGATAVPVILVTVLTIIRIWKSL